MDLSLQIDLPERFIGNARTRAVAAAFEMDDRPADSTRPLLAATRVCLSGGELTYLVGASGSGKSQLLAALARAWPGPVVRGSLGQRAEAGRPRSAVLDQLGLGVEASLRLLCSAGLGEARLWLMPPRCLSAGQADRLALARLYARVERAIGGRPLPFGSPLDGVGAGSRKRLPRGKRGGRDAGDAARVAHCGDRMRRLESRAAESGPRRRGSRIQNPESEIRSPVLLLIDEFASRLDRLTARVLAANLRRWLGRTAGVAAVVATAHDDLADALRPDWLWVKTSEGGMAVREMPNAE